MPLTPDQDERIQQAKAAGENRVAMQFTTDQRRAGQAAVDAELAGKEANITHLKKIKAAAEQPGFLGDIRRAMALSKRPLADVAAAIGVDPEQLSAFRADDAELPPTALDRLLNALGLRLMQEIPR
jgi:hypothetical protein